MSQRPQPPRAWEERGGCDLAVERRAPAARNRGAAFGARSLRGDLVALDEIAVTLDEQRLAVVAARVPEIADAPRKIAGVYVSQAVAPSDVGRVHQHLRRGVLRIAHAVVLVEC